MLWRLASKVATLSPLPSRSAAVAKQCVRRYDIYKPREQVSFLEAVENLANKDMIVFRYEDQNNVKWKALLALAMCPVYLYLGKVAFNLKSELSPYRDNVQQDRTWVLNNVLRLNNLVSAAFVLFGLGISGYWLARTRYTVKWLVLRKGGKQATFYTYGMLGLGQSSVTVPLKHCSLVQSKFMGKLRLFVQVKEHAFKYRFNIENGVFTNRVLFERTVAVGKNVS